MCVQIFHSVALRIRLIASEGNFSLPCVRRHPNPNSRLLLLLLLVVLAMIKKSEEEEMKGRALWRVRRG